MVDPEQRRADSERPHEPDSEHRQPFDDEDERPDWWRRAAAEFERHGLRPYRPPRFADGTPKHEVVDRLEAEYGVDVTFAAFDPEPDDEWAVRIDGETAFEVGHRRHRAGYSIFETTPGQFESAVRDWLDRHE
jgi:hypothetical protein